MGVTRTTELITISRDLPLGHPQSEANYGSFFGAVANSQGAAISHLTSDLEDMPKLALLIACIWAKTQVHEQNEPLVLRAAAAALAIMDAEGVRLTRPELLEVCQWYRQIFRVRDQITVSIQDETSDARVASEFLAALVN